MGFLDSFSSLVPGLGVITDLLGQDAARDAQRAANRTNIMLSREQRAWEETMSNTAVRRRVADIVAAGGNPALAFTSGQEASTPSISAPTVEPTTRAADWNYTAKALALQQARLTGAQISQTNAGAEASTAQAEKTRAETGLVRAQSRIANIEADIREIFQDTERNFRFNRFVTDTEKDTLSRDIMRSQNVSSAAEAKRLKETVDELIRMVQQQARTGELELKALENVANMGGLEANRAMPVIKLIMDFFRSRK